MILSKEQIDKFKERCLTADQPHLIEDCYFGDGGAELRWYGRNFIEIIEGDAVRYESIRKGDYKMAEQKIRTVYVYDKATGTVIEKEEKEKGEWDGVLVKDDKFKNVVEDNERYTAFQYEGRDNLTET